MIDVLEMTFSSRILESVEISSSVMPSAKNSSFGSGLIFANGKTAIRFFPEMDSLITNSLLTVPISDFAIGGLMYDLVVLYSYECIDKFTSQ